jgi:hypothetical protein
MNLFLNSNVYCENINGLLLLLLIFLYKCLCQANVLLSSTTFFAWIRGWSYISKYLNCFWNIIVKGHHHSFPFDLLQTTVLSWLMNYDDALSLLRLYLVYLLIHVALVILVLIQWLHELSSRIYFKLKC